MVLNFIIFLFVNYILAIQMDFKKLKKKPGVFIGIIFLLIGIQAALVNELSNKKPDSGLLFMIGALLFFVATPLYLLLLDKLAFKKRMVWKYRMKKWISPFLAPFVPVFFFSLLLYQLLNHLLHENEMQNQVVLLLFYSLFLFSLMSWLPVIVNIKQVLDWGYMKKILLLCLYFAIRISTLIPVAFNTFSERLSLGVTVYFTVDLFVTCMALFFIIERAGKPEEKTDKARYSRF